MIDRATRTDPSPVVKRLVDDILDLFPQRPETRASEARERSERFRSDPDLTEAKRARALKELARRHPDIVALLSDYPAQLSKGKVKVRLRDSAHSFRDKIASVLGTRQQRTPWLLAVCLLVWIIRFFDSSPPPPPYNPYAPARPPSPATKTNPTRAMIIARSIRDELKGPIRQELKTIGKTPDEPTLDRVVAVLPVEALPKVGGMATLRLNGHWTEPVRNRFVSALKESLQAHALGLTDAEIDKLAPRCFPKATPRGSP
jgi:hypothetical protein